MAEKEACGIKLSTWAKIANMLLGALMIFYSIITFFTIALDIFDDASFILIVSFRIYEMYVKSSTIHFRVPNAKSFDHFFAFLL